MSDNTVILCPGQGAQHVGMGKDFVAAHAAARSTFETANKVLGFDLSAIAFEGPEDRLNPTDISQPAIYVTSIASYRVAVAMGFLDPDTVTQYAGLSLGEYTALHLAGVFSFEEGLKLVAARGKYMQEAAVATPSGMVAVMGGDEAKLNDLCAANGQGDVLVPANFNAPGQIVVSGTLPACDRLAKAAEAAGLKAIPLKVAGAFHSPIMQSGADRMKAELERVKFNAPTKTVYSNVTAKPHEAGDSIKKLLVDQIVQPVRWEQTMQQVVLLPGLRLIELSPGRVLTGMIKKINRRQNVESLATAETLSVPGASA